MFHVKGILLEYIEGFPLSEMRQHATELEWLEIVQKAKGIIQTMGGHNVLHGDPRSQNFIVSRTEREDGTKELRVFVIDFSRSRTRCPDESDDDWRNAVSTKGQIIWTQGGN
jgi:tRNA A-37 threonylcarbamoyl transferase component Bud32